MRILKVVPLFGWLLTEISPPLRWTDCLTKVSPKPAPAVWDLSVGLVR
jgi:hypothetical protein